MVDAAERFLGKLAGVTDPEQKRKIIGREFIAVFEEEARKIQAEGHSEGEAEFLVQGTLYPDVIESAYKGPSATIKSHHNGWVARCHEAGLGRALRELFKDEVRALGVELGLPHHVLWRQPFPGPALACASWDPFLNQTATFFGRQTSSSSLRFARPVYTRRSGKLLGVVAGQDGRRHGGRADVCERFGYPRGSFQGRHDRRLGALAA